MDVPVIISVFLGEILIYIANVQSQFLVHIYFQIDFN